MLKVVFFFLLLLPSFVFSSTQLSYSEVILESERGEMLSQVSGLGRLADWVVVLVQDKNTLYIVQETKLARAYKNNQERIRLTPVPITMNDRQTVSWEAIEFAEVEGKHYAFFFHEHDFEGDSHQIYFGQVKQHNKGFSLDRLAKLGSALPLLQNDELSLARRENYGYEAILWDNATKKLLLLPELKTQPKFSLDLSGSLLQLDNAVHDLRASDMTNFSKQCAIVTSFCYQSESFSDALCQGYDGSPRLSLATFSKSNGHLKYIESKDLTSFLMPVGFDPNYSRSKERSRTFNVEGIVPFNNGLLLANDNKPQGKSRSVLRYVRGIQVDPRSCRFSF